MNVVVLSFEFIKNYWCGGGVNVWCDFCWSEFLKIETFRFCIILIKIGILCELPFAQVDPSTGKLVDVPKKLLKEYSQYLLVPVHWIP